MASLGALLRYFARQSHLTDKSRLGRVIWFLELVKRLLFVKSATSVVLECDSSVGCDLFNTSIISSLLH